jgi:hypothetical protein
LNPTKFMDFEKPDQSVSENQKACTNGRITKRT